jgi:hypothetical protein
VIDSNLGPRLKVVALIDPFVQRSEEVLQKKRDSLVVGAYQDTAMHKTVAEFAAAMTDKQKPQ